VIDTESVKAIVLDVLALHTGLPRDAIYETMDVQLDLGLDSVDAAELLIVLERRSGLRLDIEHLDDIQTVADIVARLRSPVSHGEGADA
jgi:acyl carrier protein